MASGNLLKKFRELKGLTQKKLGENLGFDDSRIRQYESGRRRPKSELLKEIAEELKVAPEYLDDTKYPYSMDESLRMLFKMEDSLPIDIEEIEIVIDEKYDLKEKKYAIYFSGEEGIYLDHFLKLWQERKKEYKENFISEEQYEQWKANWPKSIKDDYQYSNVNIQSQIYNDGLNFEDSRIWLDNKNE